MYTNEVFLQVNFIYRKHHKIYANQNENFEMKLRIQIRK